MTIFESCSDRGGDKNRQTDLCSVHRTSRWRSNHILARGRGLHFDILELSNKKAGFIVDDFLLCLMLCESYIIYETPMRRQSETRRLEH